MPLMQLVAKKEVAAMNLLWLTAPALLTLSSGLLAADTVPQFKIESCREAEDSGPASRNAQSCFRDEQTAKETLQQKWSSYDSSQKKHCALLMKAGGMPSYVELLTCIEMKTEPTTSTVDTKKKNGVRAPSSVD